MSDTAINELCTPECDISSLFKLMERQNIRKEWDHHGSYKWTYFTEGIKQIISYYLSFKLKGLNLDIGSGWYMHYPDSVAVDVSPINLKNNILDKKICIDLEDIAFEKGLPFKDNTFDSVTMVSVWQYLRNVKPILNELERVSKPGAEIYIINGQNSGVYELKKRSSSSKDICEEMLTHGFDSMIEIIPNKGGHDVFQSVTARIPKGSVIENKQFKIDANVALVNNWEKFLDGVASDEVETIKMLYHNLGTYPVTGFSRRFLNKIEMFSQEYFNIIGEIPIIFCEYDIQPEVDMMRYNSKIFPTLVSLKNNIDDDRDEYYSDAEKELRKRYNLSIIHSINFFGEDNIEGIKNRIEQLGRNNYYYLTDNRKYDTFIRFIASVKLNSFAYDLEKEMYDMLKLKVKDLDSRIEKAFAWDVYFQASQNKQARRIDALLETKKKILDDRNDIIRFDRFAKHYNAIPYLKDIVLRNL